jgi:ABC-type metal ion transport system substrate-binding protein
MIRNLKSYGDDEKQLMTLKEQLDLAIKNDEFVAAARANAQKNIPLEPSREDQRTLAEQIADEDSQRVQAQAKLSQLFKAPEVLTILGLLNKDQIVAINTLLNGIKDDLKGLNT